MTVEKHFVVATAPAYGHTRPMLGLCAHMLAINPNLGVTLFIRKSFADVAKRELSRYNYPKDHLRIIHSGEVEIVNEWSLGVKHELDKGPKIFEQLARELDVDSVYAGILKGDPVRDTVTGQMVASFEAKPTALFTEMLMTMFTRQGGYLDNDVGRKIKHFKIDFASTGHFFRTTMLDPFPDSQASYVERVRRVKDEVRNGSTPEEGYDRWVARNEDRVDLPLVGPVYLYEYAPTRGKCFSLRWISDSTLAADPPMYWNAIPEIHAKLQDLGAMVLVWPACLSQPAIDYATSQGYTLHCIGAQLPDRIAGLHRSLGSGLVLDFLEKALRSEGEHSVLYISFGTFRYPASERETELLLQTLIKLRQRTVIVKGVCGTEIEALYDRYEKEGEGCILISGYLDQYALLHHTAVCAYLSHAGTGGVMEAAEAGVPQIYWPYAGDHVSTAKTMSIVEEVGIELYQVRKGYNIGRKTAARGVLVEGTEEAMLREFEQVITDMRGKKGEQLRQNARALGARIAQDMRDGPSHQALKALAFA